MRSYNNSFIYECFFIFKIKKKIFEKIKLKNAKKREKSEITSKETTN